MRRDDVHKTVAPGAAQYSVGDSNPAHRVAHGELHVTPSSPCGVKTTLALAVLNTLRRCIIVTDTDGTIRVTNQSADQLLRSADPLRVSRQNRLEFRHKTSHLRMRRFLSTGPADNATLALHLPRRTQPIPLDIVLRWLPAGTLQTPCCLVTCIDRARRAAPDLGLLSELYGLTAAQCRVVNLLYHGLTVTEIGARLNCSVHTVRAHLKAAFRRSGVHSQTELVRLVASSLKLGRTAAPQLQAQESR